MNKKSLLAFLLFATIILIGGFTFGDLGWLLK